MALLLGAFSQACDSMTSGGDSMTMAANTSSLSPQTAAELFGFATIDAFAAWLGTLPASERDAILLGLFNGGGEL